MTDSQVVTWAGTEYRMLFAAGDGAGQVGIVESVSPAGSGPPRHVHHDADETFYVLSGHVDFWVDGETLSRGPGEVAHVKRGAEHSFQVHDDGPGRHLVILTPGGFEGFFWEMASGAYAIPEDMARITEIARRYKLSFTGPPLGME